jgi:hypothetical protein
MDLILHAKCLQPSLDFNLLTDISTFDIQLNESKKQIKERYERSTKDYNSLVLSQFALSADVGVQPFTVKTFDSIMLNSGATNKLFSDELTELTHDPRFYSLPPISTELVLPLTKRFHNFNLLLNCQTEEGPASTVSPNEYLLRLKKTIDLIQRVIYLKTRTFRTLPPEGDESRIILQAGFMELEVTLRQTFAQIFAQTPAAGFAVGDAEDGEDEEDEVDEINAGILEFFANFVDF